MVGYDLSITAPSPTSGRAYFQNANRHPIERPVLQYSGEQYSEQSQASEHSQSSQTTQSSQSSQASQNRKFRKTGTGGGAWNAPIAHFTMTETSGQTYGFGTKTEERYCRLAEEGKKWMLGPMPPRDFLDLFLKQDDGWACQGEMPAAKGAFAAVPMRAKLEKDIYEPLARAINQGRCPGFTFCVTSEAADSSGPLGLTGSCKPDICCYANEHLSKVKNYTAKPPSKCQPKPKRKDNTGDELGGDTGRAGESNFDDEADGADSDSESGLSDAGTVRQTSPATAAAELESLTPADSTSSSPEPVPMKHTHMGYAALVIEIKQSLLHDVFRDPKLEDNRAEFHFVTELKHPKVLKRLGQQVSYASEMCKRQHRHFCFTISLCSHYARFIRWDRAGAIVSERFSVLTQPELLCDFLWRFAWASHAQRGYDLTVEPATAEQATIFKRAIEAHVIKQGGPTVEPKYRGAVKEHYEEESVTVIHLPSSQFPPLDPEQLVSCLLVSRPIAIPLSVAGRGTRTYWAVDPLTEDVWLLKDTWRYNAPEGSEASEREGDVLRTVGEVTGNVPTVIHHDDVLRSIVVVDDDPSLEETDSLTIQHTVGDVQTTATQDFLESSWVCRGDHRLDQLRRFIFKRTHYRLVLGVAGYPLLRFKDSNELLHATYDAFGALKAAFEKSKRLHRDVTPGNIILYNDSELEAHSTESTDLPRPRKGYLIDWELSRKCQLNESKSGELYVARGDESCAVSATWQFVSAAIAVYVKQDDAPQQRHTVSDDIESMTYVVLYCALLWLPFEKPNPWAIQNVLEMFNYWTPWQDGVVRGGALKQDNLVGEQVYTRSLQWTVPIIQEWLSKALKRIARGTASKERTVEMGFHDWWGRFLEKYQGAEHHAKRFDNTRVKVFRELFTSKKSAAVMEEVAHQSTISAPGSSSHPTFKKRLRAGDDGEPAPSGAGSSSKRPRWDDVVASGEWHLLPTSWRASEDESTIDTIQAAPPSSWESSRASTWTVSREVMETESGVEGDPDAYESDHASEADEGPAGEEQGDEDEGPKEVDVSAGKGKGRAMGVKGWGLYEPGGLVSLPNCKAFRKDFMDAETVRDSKVPVPRSSPTISEANL